MPTLQEVRQEVAGAGSGSDLVRRKYLRALAHHTKRPALLYASALGIKDAPPQASIVQQDVAAFMSALNGLKGPDLDLILHSPGGSAEAAEQIVNYLRRKFTNIRAIVPQNAMSAATMICCAADRIVMGNHSAIGPIDPQIQINMSNAGGQVAVVPAQSILDEYELAKAEISKSPVAAAIWGAKIAQYIPGLLIMCQNSVDLAQILVQEWLEKYMFGGRTDAAQSAKSIAEWLGNHANFKTHGRPIGIALAQGKGLIVESLEADQKFQDLVLSVFHAAVATFHLTPCVKIVENSFGKGSFVLVAPPK